MACVGKRFYVIVSLFRFPTPFIHDRDGGALLQRMGHDCGTNPRTEVDHIFLYLTSITIVSRSPKIIDYIPVNSYFSQKSFSFAIFTIKSSRTKYYNIHINAICNLSKFTIHTLLPRETNRIGSE
jgi:hypothetical protein